jgi:ABC-type glycerol-3-phosphate transport system substrate-binding protein
MKYKSVIVIILLLLVSCGQQERKTELRIWHTENDKKTHTAFEKVEKILEQKYKDLDVVYEYIPWGQLSQKLKLSMSSSDSKRNMPDITHLQPYMAYSLFEKGLLEDITDIVNELNNNQNNSISLAVKDLQKFNNRYYGIAQHMGISYILYRKDILNKLGLETPKTKKQFLDLCEKLRKNGHQYPVVMPGSSPFFMECILSEYLNTAGSSIVDEKLKVRLVNNKPLIEVLQYFADLSKYVTPQYKTIDYLDQFDMIMGDDGPIFIMFAGARAFQNFQEKMKDASTEKIAALEPVSILDGKKSYTSIDCEPFVIINKNKKKNYYARQWFIEFYKHENYIKFCETVPIQLMPIYTNMRKEYEYNDSVKKWRQWYDYANMMIDSNRVRPYFMLTTQRTDLDFLYELHNSNILYNLILYVMNEKKVDLEMLQLYEKQIDELITKTSKKRNGE